MKKYLNVNVIDFLQKVVDENTKHYKEDFEYDKAYFKKSVGKQHDRCSDSLLWLSRENGTLCVREFEAFIKDSPAHISWKYYAGDDFNVPENVVAYSVKLCEEKNGVVLGDIYELDYKMHVSEMIADAVPGHEVEKYFDDGYHMRAPLKESSYGRFASLIEEHGPIVDSLVVPESEDALIGVLRKQNMMRSKMPVAHINPPRLDDIISDAKSRRDGDASSVAREMVFKQDKNNNER